MTVPENYDTGETIFHPCRKNNDPRYKIIYRR